MTIVPNLLKEKLHRITILMLMILSIADGAVSVDGTSKLNFSEVNFKWEIGQFISKWI